MSKNLKRALKITFISMLSLIVIVLSAIAVAVNFVFTPEKLTPVVNQIANRTLNAQVEIGSVELTFFSSFPDFELKISDGRLVSKVFKDTLWQKSDTLLQFKKCAVSVNPLLYFQNNRVELRKFLMMLRFMRLLTVLEIRIGILCELILLPCNKMPIRFLRVLIAV